MGLRLPSVSKLRTLPFPPFSPERVPFLLPPCSLLCVCVCVFLGGTHSQHLQTCGRTSGSFLERTKDWLNSLLGWMPPRSFSIIHLVSCRWASVGQRGLGQGPSYTQGIVSFKSPKQEAPLERLNTCLPECSQPLTSRSSRLAPYQEFHFVLCIAFQYPKPFRQVVM